MDTSRTPISALLLVRAVVGVAFLLHGLDKFSDLDGTQQGFDGMGIPLPEVMAPFVLASLEVAGGSTLIVGALTPVFALGLAGNMLVAYLTAHMGKGFFVSDGGAGVSSCCWASAASASSRRVPAATPSTPPCASAASPASPPTGRSPTRGSDPLTMRFPL